MEQMQYSLLFRWFDGLGVEDPVWVPTVFTKNRDRPLTTEISRKVMAAIMAQREVARLLSDKHIWVDSTLGKAWASMMSFQPKADGAPPQDDGPDDPPGHDTPAKDQPAQSEPECEPTPYATHQHRNTEVDFRGEKRSNAAPVSTTDPEARIYKKSSGRGAMPCFMGHALMENRCGAIVQGAPTQADIHAERRAALNMIDRHSPGSPRRLMLGADKGYDADGFVAGLREACVTPPCRAEIPIFSDHQPDHPTRGLCPVDQAPQAVRRSLRLGHNHWRHYPDRPSRR